MQNNSQVYATHASSVPHYIHNVTHIVYTHAYSHTHTHIQSILCGCSFLAQNPSEMDWIFTEMQCSLTFTSQTYPRRQKSHKQCEIQKLTPNEREWERKSGKSFSRVNEWDSCMGFKADFNIFSIKLKHFAIETRQKEFEVSKRENER